MKTFLKIGGVALLFVAIVVAVGAGLAAAQKANTPSAAANTTTNSSFDPLQVILNNGDQDLMSNSGMMAHGGMGIIDRPTIVAEALGITVEELQAAHAEGKTLPQLVSELGLDLEEVQANIQAGVTEAINQAVTDGSITQEQADLMLERMELRILVHDALDMNSIVADALGITVEELQAARATGQRVPDLISALGLDPATVRTAIQEGRTAAINQAVSDGILTQEQADWLLSHPRMGRQGGHHGQGGNFPNTPPTEEPTSADNA